ncbi:MAG TPA: DUF2336 domain-containing protein [Xanthobacteraceae bacterium]|jgi:uncharacterized protein (DUF2336 family)
MSAHPSLIPELEEAVRRGSPERRAKTLERITALFLAGADRFNDEHVQLFDLVLGRLSAEVEIGVRTELSRRLAPLANAPAGVVRCLARDDDIAVAGLVLGQCRRLAESELMDIAETKSQAHLVAIAGRPRIAAPVTDVLLRRGNREVALKLAENRSAHLSHDGLVALIERAESDDALAEKVGLRPDLPPRVLRDLLLETAGAAQQRLPAAAADETQSQTGRTPAKVSGTTGATGDHSFAERAIAALRQNGRLSEAALVDFARDQRYSETIAALASLCAVPIGVVDRLMGAERPDPVLILCKSAGWGWPTAHAVIMARPGGPRTSNQSLAAAYADFERLSPATARRVLRFWQARPDDGRWPTDDRSGG